LRKQAHHLVRIRSRPDRGDDLRAAALPVHHPPARGNADQPGQTARDPSSSSIRSSWLYFATRSERAGAPVLICPAFVATARSAIVASSVSPERCEITAVHPPARASRIAWNVSVTVPTWFSFTSTELQIFASTALRTSAG